MASPTRRHPARIDAVLLTALVFCAGCTGGHGASHDTTASAAAAPPFASTSSPSGQRQLMLLTQSGIDEDIGYVDGATTFYDCEKSEDVGLLRPHSLVAVGIDECIVGARLVEYVRTQVGSSLSRTDIATVVKLGLSQSPDAAGKIRSLVGASHRIDAARAGLIATNVHAIARGSDRSPGD